MLFDAFIESKYHLSRSIACPPRINPWLDFGSENLSLQVLDKAPGWDGLDRLGCYLKAWIVGESNEPL